MVVVADAGFGADHCIEVGEDRAQVIPAGGAFADYDEVGRVGRGAHQRPAAAITLGAIQAAARTLKGVVARTMDELTEALNQAITDQMENGITTLIEAMINQELGAPFRRDAMKKPVEVAGIDPADMRPQVTAQAAE